MKFRYLVVEGPIGAGKTSLARRLAARMGADLVLELPEENPFLARFYEDMARYALPTRSPTPDMVVYLQAQPATLIERVKRRARGYERPVSEEYLALLAESYARFFYHYNAAPVLIVNSDNLNFVERDADFELLVSRLRGMKSRREFFNLG